MAIGLQRAIAPKTKLVSASSVDCPGLKIRFSGEIVSGCAEASLCCGKVGRGRK